MADAAPSAPTLQGIRILVVHDQLVARTHFIRVLTHEGAAVEAISRAELAAKKSTPDLVFLAEPPAQLKTYQDTIKLTRQVWPKTWVLAGYPESASGALGALIGAGADDIVKIPCPSEEFRVRLAACRRLMHRDEAREHDWSGGSDITQKRAWQSIPRFFCSELSAFTGVELSNVQSALETPIVVEIPLTLARDRVEIIVRVRLPHEAAAGLCRAMLGMDTPEPSVVDDLAKEAANTLAGAYKRNAEEDGLDSAIGLPRLQLTDIETPIAAHHLCFGNGSVVLHADVFLVQIKDQVVPATSLREGMVIVADIRTAGGALLIPAGTRLTATSAARLASHLGERATVTVANVETAAAA